MAYRILVTAVSGEEKADFILRSGDPDVFDDAKTFVEYLKGIAAKDLACPSKIDWIEAYYDTRVGRSTNSLVLWGRDTMPRAEWIKVYAEREYVVDLLTGEVSSPQWSLDMDEWRPEIEMLKIVG